MFARGSHIEAVCNFDQEFRSMKNYLWLLDFSLLKLLIAWFYKGSKDKNIATPYYLKKHVDISHSKYILIPWSAPKKNINCLISFWSWSQCFKHQLLNSFWSWLQAKLSVCGSLTNNFEKKLDLGMACHSLPLKKAKKWGEMPLHILNPIPSPHFMDGMGLRRFEIGPRTVGRNSS